jgi:hypothetical protein
MLLAQVLAARGARKQALFELRLAVEYEGGLADSAAPLATALARNREELLTAVPEGLPGAIVLSMMARTLQKPEQLALRRSLDEEALARDPGLVEPRQRILTELFAALSGLAKGAPQAPGCGTIEACSAEVEKHAAAIEAVQPDSSIGAVTRARGLIALGKRAQAEAMLATGCAQPEGRTECLQVRVENLSHMNEGDKLEAALKEYMSNGCMSASTCATTATFVGSVRAQRGDLHAAAAAFMRAAQEEPNEERWLRAADAAERAKMNVQAIEALQRVSSLRGGADPEIAARIARVRAATAEQIMHF